MRKILILIAALLCVVGGVAIATQSSAAAETSHKQTVTAPTSETDITDDVCSFTNPNPNLYTTSRHQLSVFRGTPSPVINTAQPNAPPVVHQDIRVFCQWVPWTANKAFGVICRVLDKHNNPFNIYWAGEDYNWRVTIDYYACPDL